jgi:5-methylcytosine-specific restriction protein B
LRSLEGFYLTPAPADLVATLNDAYTDLTGKQILSTPVGDAAVINPVACSFEDLLQTTLWSESELNELLDVFSADGSCKQVILTGPPGTGKTWVAMQVVKYLTNADDSRWRLIQLHPSYSYEQFVEGLRPVADHGAITFKPVKGLLLDMVDRCKAAHGAHFLVMDEMNRANLPRVLGELLFLFEYRQAKIDLPYTREFMLPENLYFIGTMNTADRSIRSIDAALRRRVEIFECRPSRSILEAFYETNTNQVADLFDGFDQLNITLENLLDKHHTVGHTFLMAKVFSPTTLRIAWRRKIRPLIEEYFFDRAAELKIFEIETFWPSLA